MSRSPLSGSNGALGAGLLILGSCATYEGTGETYSAAGRHEFAVPYFVGHHLTHLEEPEAKQRLEREVRVAFESLQAEHDDHVRSEQHAEALGAACRLADLVLDADRAGVSELPHKQVAERVAQSWQRAATEARQRFDRAEVRKPPPPDLGDLARRAKALTPDDPDLDRRYRELLAQKVRYVQVQRRAQAKDDGLARSLTERIVAKVCSVRRELITLATGSAHPELDTDLVVSLEDVRRVDTGPRQVDSGAVEALIPRLNHYQEAVFDAEGKRVFDAVRASYTIFEWTRSVSVTAAVAATDLGPAKTNLLSKRASRSAQDVRRFLRWTGDERALAGQIFLMTVGTDESPPKPLHLLATEAAAAVADALADEVIQALEYR